MPKCNVHVELYKMNGQLNQQVDVGFGMTPSALAPYPPVGIPREQRTCFITNIWLISSANNALCVIVDIFLMSLT